MSTDAARRPRGRTCTRCGRWKQAAAFRVNVKMRSGLSSWCRRCFVARTREWRAEHAEELNARRRARRAEDAAWRAHDLARRRAIYAQRSAASIARVGGRALQRDASPPKRVPR